MLSLQLLRLLIAAPLPPSHASPLLRRIRFLEANQTISGGAPIESAEPLLYPPFKRAFPFVRIVLIVVLPVLTILFFLPSLLVLYMSLFSYTTTIAPMVNIAFGLILAVSVARLIAFERERKTYDVLALIPMGRFGLHLIYCRNWLRMHPFYGWLLVPFLFIGTASLALGIGILPVFPASVAASDPFVLLIGQRALLIGALIVDALQSLVSAALIGMLAPAFSSTRTNAQIGAAAAIFGVQIAAYGLFYTFSAVLVPLLMTIFPAGFAGIAATLVIVLIFIVTRELIIMVMWRMLADALGVSAAELDLTSGTGV